jgi:hypothetical protein
MPNEVIDRVHLLACNNERDLTFGNCNGIPDDTDPFKSDGESYDADEASDDGADDASVDYDSDSTSDSSNDDDANNTDTFPLQE